MIVDPSISQPQPLPTPGVRSSQDIVDHLDRVLAAQPPEVQSAVGHAHGILGLQSPVNAAAGAAGSPIAASPNVATPEAPAPISASPAVASPIVAAGSPTDAQPIPNPGSWDGKPSPTPITYGEHMSSTPPPPMADPSMYPSAIAATSAAPVTTDPASGLAITPSTPQSNAPAAPAPIQNPHMQNLERMTTEGIGTNKIHNPFLRGLATVGDAIGSGLFPEFARFVPGTSAHHQQLIGEEENQLGTEQKATKAKDESDQSQAVTAHEQAVTSDLPASSAATQAHLAAQAKLANQQADTLATEGKQKPKDKYITVPGGGLFNAETREWERQPTDKSQLYELSEEVGKQHKVKPDADGRYYIPNASAGEILKTPTPKEGDDKEKFVQQYLKEKGLADSATNRGSALAEYAKVSQAPQRAPIVNVNAQDHQEQMHGKGLLDAAEKAYRGAVQSADSTAEFIKAAKGGNKVTAEVLPLENALEITTAQGVHRINRNEIDQIAGAGSLFDQIKSKIGKWTKGQPVPDGLLNDMAKMSDILKKGAYKTYRDAHTSAVKRYGLKDEEPLPDPGKTYTQSDVDAAVAANHGSAQQIEDAFKAKGYVKQ